MIRLMLSAFQKIMPAHLNVRVRFIKFLKRCSVYLCMYYERCLSVCYPFLKPIPHTVILTVCVCVCMGDSVET